MAVAVQSRRFERIWNVKIYLATWLEDNQGKTLTKISNKNRLLSYFFIKQNEKFDLREYARKGLLKLKNRHIWD